MNGKIIKTGRLLAVVFIEKKYYVILDENAGKYLSRGTVVCFGIP